MKLIADSGSTKTAWNLALNGEIINSFTTSGINPTFQTSEEITRQLINEVIPNFGQIKIESCDFYGAGCANKTINKNLAIILQKVFSCEKATVSSDILGAARALFDNENGIATILGTGSNCCYYDGTQIQQSVKSGGFILGDEGSGGALGKRLISDFIKKQMPNNIYNKIKDEYQLDYLTIINNVYKQPFPNRYLANFSHFMSKNRNNEYIQQLIYSEFDAFFKRNITQFENWQKINLGFVGSIAHIFKEELHCVSKTYNIKINKIIQSPIEELIKFHHQNKI